VTVQEVLDQLNNEGFTKIADTIKVGYINDVYYDVLSREVWPFLHAKANFSVASGATSLNLPSDFRAAISVGIRENGTRLIWERPERLVARYPNDTALSTTGAPAYFYFEGNTISLYPVPNATFTVDLEYYKAPAKLLQADVEATILIPQRHHRILVAGALNRLYKLEKQFDNAGQFKAEFDERLTTMRSELLNQQYSDSDYIELVDPEDFNYENPQY
jgi:hypothetical protein